MLGCLILRSVTLKRVSVFSHLFSALMRRCGWEEVPRKFPSRLLPGQTVLLEHTWAFLTDVSSRQVHT